jgi:hypothetical protein
MTVSLCPETLRTNPQLASLDLLVNTLETAIVALCAAHPSIERKPIEITVPIDRLADRLVIRATLTLEAADRYRRLLHELELLYAESLDDDVDF